MYIDSHCHLTHDDFDTDRGDVIARAIEAGVEAMLTIGTTPADSRLARDLALDHEAIYATAGMHPHEAQHYNPVALAEILRLSNEEKVLAIGEIGLDYHYDFSPREKQKQVFQELVTAAVQVGRPVVVHSREAEEDTLAILGEAGRPPLRGVMHSFTGSMQMMRRAVEMGLHIGITGIVTFKNAQPLRDVVKEIPPAQLLIETDSPYLAPEPHRGKRNEPAFVAEVCRAVAEVRGVKENTIARRSRENFRHLFGLEG